MNQLQTNFNHKEFECDIIVRNQNNSVGIQRNICKKYMDLKDFYEMDYDDIDKLSRIVLKCEDSNYVNVVLPEFQYVKDNEHLMFNVIKEYGGKPIANISNKSKKDEECITRRCIKNNLISKNQLDYKFFSGIIFGAERDCISVVRYINNSRFDIALFKMEKMISYSQASDGKGNGYNHIIELRRVKNIDQVRIASYYSFIAKNRLCKRNDTLESYEFIRTYSLNPKRKQGTNLFFKNYNNGKFRANSNSKKVFTYNKRACPLEILNSNEDILLSSYTYGIQYQNYDDIIVDGFVKNIITERNLHRYSSRIVKFRNLFLKPTMNISKFIRIIFKDCDTVLIGFKESDLKIHCLYILDGKIKYYTLNKFEISHIQYIRPCEMTARGINELPGIIHLNEKATDIAFECNVLTKEVKNNGRKFK